MSIANLGEDLINEIESKIRNITGGIVDDDFERVQVNFLGTGFTSTATSGQIQITSGIVMSESDPVPFTITNPKITENSMIILKPILSGSETQVVRVSFGIVSKTSGSAQAVAINYTTAGITADDFYYTYTIIN